MPAKILVVDDEPNITSSFSSLLRDEGYQPDTAASAEEAARRCDHIDYSLILLDLNLPGQSGLEFLRQLRRGPMAPLVLVISGLADIPTALEAIRLGAVDYLEKPVKAEKLLASVRASLALASAHRQRTIIVDDIDDRSQITGESRAVRGLLETVAQAAPTDSAILIEGENGTGKELVATRVYLQSRRRDQPFVKVNCPGIPASLFESQLFGHTRGAFTGAVKDYPGKFVQADGGTIFLDEIGDLPLDCQAKLLRVLETGEVETLGAVDSRSVDVRLICATNRTLKRLVDERRFREDLYYRISVLVINVPPLRERLDDVPLLVGEFLRRLDPSGRTSLSAEAVAYLATLTYPGNIRQLKNIVERLTILCRDRQVSLADVQSQAGEPGRDIGLDHSSSLVDRLRNFEKQLIGQTLKDCDGNISEAARLLHTDRANLSRKIKDYGLR